MSWGRKKQSEFAGKKKCYLKGGDNAISAEFLSPREQKQKKRKEKKEKNNQKNETLETREHGREQWTDRRRNSGACKLSQTSLQKERKKKSR